MDRSEPGSWCRRGSGAAIALLGRGSRHRESAGALRGPVVAPGAFTPALRVSRDTGVDAGSNERQGVVWAGRNIVERRPPTGSLAPFLLATTTPDERRRSDRENLEGGIQASQIVRVRGGHPLVRSTRAHDDVRVDDVGRAAGGEKPADVGGVNAVEINDDRRRLADQSGEPRLALGPPYGLGGARAGTVSLARVSAARASKTARRRSLRSTASSPPASSVRPGIRRPTPSAAPKCREARRPKRVLRR